MGRVLFSGGKPGMEKPVGFSPVLNENTWAQIRKASDAGIASNLWSVGDTKAIVINGTVGVEPFSNLSIDAFILGFNHNASVEGSNRIHFQIGKINGVDVALCDSKYRQELNASGTFAMTTTKNNSGGWNNSHMRKTVLGSDKAPTSPTPNTLLAAFPSDLRAVMKSIVKRTDNTGGGSDTASYVTTTTDYLPLLSEFEVRGARAYANSAEQNYQQQYAYYAAGNSTKKYNHNKRETAVIWWLRSPDALRAEDFCVYSDTGSVSDTRCGWSWGLAPIFAV